MTLLTIFAEMNVISCLTVAKGSVTLAIGPVVIRDASIEAVLLSAAKYALSQPIAMAYSEKIKEWLDRKNKP
jgi:hypothetical protein